MSFSSEATQMRLELTTSAVTGRRSNQLSHWATLFYYDDRSPVIIIQ